MVKILILIVNDFLVFNLMIMVVDELAEGVDGDVQYLHRDETQSGNCHRQGAKQSYDRQRCYNPS